MMLSCELLIIGSEIIAGKIADTNSGFLAQKLFDMGIQLTRITIIGDKKEEIMVGLGEAISRSDLVLTAGGLGPTPDDNTTAIAAKIFNRRLILDESLLEQIEKHFAKIKKKMPEALTRQALVPQGAVLLENPVGMAPGLILKNGTKTIILLPGVPIELEKVFVSGVIPFLEGSYSLKPVMTKTIRTTNIAESEIFEKISRYFVRHKGVEVAYLPQHTGVDIRIWTDKDKKLLAACEKEIVSRLKLYVYGFNTTNIEEVVGQILRKKKLTIATAESCTAGLVADRITDVPGSSEYFIGGVVAYSNEIKKLVCGVKQETLNKFGAVGKETVLEMAKGIKEHYKTDIGLSISGIAGPSGGTPKKPVGLVYFGIAMKRSANFEERIFSGNRRMIKEKAAMAAIDLLRITLESGV
ncbi:MAG: competence/damage-inducible protein A [candidate division WOR-3 bacterium]|nr:competence/damage-inducible protein A [candidate division WOR-3 bacterium]